MTSWPAITPPSPEQAARVRRAIATLARAFDRAAAALRDIGLALAEIGRRVDAGVVARHRRANHGRFHATFCDWCRRADGRPPPG